MKSATNISKPLFSRAWRLVKEVVSEVRYLYDTYAPLNVYFVYFQKLNNGSSLKKKYAAQVQSFEGVKKNLKLSNDWFSKNVPFWLSIIEEYGLHERQIAALEIGSWEGLSSYFILNSMPSAQLTCVDTWRGADEHQDSRVVLSDVVAQIENTFDRNTVGFASRLTKYKGTSFSFFNQSDALPDRYDFIYIDGSHYCDDVIIDAIKCFEMLKVGGVMIFDDYFWRYYINKIENPAGAINLFLRLKKGQYRIIRFYYQIVIIKTSSRY